MAEENIKKIQPLTVEDDNKNDIKDGETGQLVNYKALENSGEDLTAYELTQTQAALALKVNEIIERIYEDFQIKLNSVQLAILAGVEFTKEEKDKLSKTASSEELKEYIRKDLMNVEKDGSKVPMTESEKDKIIGELLGLTSEKVAIIKGAPKVITDLNDLIGSGGGKAFIQYISDPSAGIDGESYDWKYLKKENIDKQIDAKIGALPGMLSDDGNNHLVFGDQDKGKQILVTKTDGTVLPIDDPNALTTKNYVDKGLNEKMDTAEGLIGIHDELRFKKIIDKDGNEVPHVLYYNIESQHYVNQYITRLETYDGFNGVSVSASTFSIYERLSSIGNEFSGQLIKQNDWTEYEFNVKWRPEGANSDQDGIGDQLIKVRFIATKPNAIYKFARYDNENITISVINATIEIKIGDKITTYNDAEGHQIKISELFLGDKYSALTRFRVYIDGGITESIHDGNKYAPLLQLMMKVHADYAVRRIIVAEKRDFDSLDSEKQDNLSQKQIDALNDISSDNPTFLKISEYDLVDSAIHANTKVFLHPKELLLEDNAGNALPQTSENAAASIKIVNDKISAVTGGALDNKIQGKFTQNSDSLTMNEVGEINKQAKLGDGFKGDSYYSHNSTGKITVGGNDNLAPGQTPGTIEIGAGSKSIEIGKAAEVIKVGELALDTQINFANGTDALPVPSNVIKKDPNNNESKIFKRDGTAGISLEKLATIDTYVDDEVKKATVASDWEVVSDVPVIQFTTSPGTGGTGNTVSAEIPWLTDKYTDLSKFENDGKNYEVVKFNLNKDGSNNPEGIQFLVKVGAEVKQFKTWEEIVVFLEANNWEAVKKINDFTFSASSTGGAIAYSEHFGDLDDQAQRTNFMNNVKIGYWYTFNIGGNPYQAAIVSGDKTSNFIWAGKRVIQGATGKTTEFVAGSTSVTGHSETASSFTGDAFSPSIALPNSYTPTQYMPTDAIKQLILDNNASLTQNVSDPTWQSLTGTQTTSFNASQITIDITNSQLKENDIIQLLLGATGGNMVLNGALKIYGNVADASRNGYVAGQYKWYAYKFSDTVIKFVMEDSMSALTDNGQTISKFRIVTPNVQRFTAHYTSQANVLKNSVWLGDLAKGQSLIATLPTGLTLEETGYLGLSVSGTTDWDEIEGWDKVSAFYASVMTEDTSNTWWVEYKFEAVPGDNTKIKVTNFDSGNQTTSGQTYRAHWLHFKKGGK